MRSLDKETNPHSKNRVSLLWGRHQGMDAYVVGTGTSLTGFEFSRIHRRKRSFSIGLNDALLADGFCPDYSLFCDSGIWKRYRDLELHPRTLMVCQQKARNEFIRYDACSFKDRVWHFNHVSQAKGCNPKNDDLFVARTVATGGIMLAWKLGARRVFLLGVDGYRIHIPNQDGGIYYHDGRSKGREGRNEKPIKGTDRVVQDRHDWWKKNMDELREWFDARKVYQEDWRGSNVYNLSPFSSITTWQKLHPRKIFGKEAFK